MCARRRGAGAGRGQSCHGAPSPPLRARCLMPFWEGLFFLSSPPLPFALSPPPPPSSPLSPSACFPCTLFFSRPCSFRLFLRSSSLPLPLFLLLSSHRPCSALLDTGCHSLCLLVALPVPRLSLLQDAAWIWNIAPCTRSSLSLSHPLPLFEEENTVLPFTLTLPPTPPHPTPPNTQSWGRVSLAERLTALGELSSGGPGLRGERGRGPPPPPRDRAPFPCVGAGRRTGVRAPVGLNGLRARNLVRGWGGGGSSARGRRAAATWGVGARPGARPPRGAARGLAALGCGCLCGDGAWAGGSGSRTKPAERAFIYLFVYFAKRYNCERDRKSLWRVWWSRGHCELVSLCVKGPLSLWRQLRAFNPRRVAPRPPRAAGAARAPQPLCGAANAHRGQDFSSAANFRTATAERSCQTYMKSSVLRASGWFPCIEAKP